MKRQTGADAGMTAAILLLGASLVFAGASVLRLRFSGGSFAGPLEMDEAIGALAAGTGIAVALWWLLAMACAVVSTVAALHGKGRIASAAALWSPAFMRRLAAAVLGLNLLSAPLALAASPVGPIDPLWHAESVAAAPLHPAPSPTAKGPAVTSPAPQKPVDPAWTPQAPAADPGALARPATRQPAPAIDGGDPVVVQGGDSLWSIVAAALGPYASDVEVAQAWPEWYRVNRGVIGADPNVILPGQVLHAPAG
ncbi:LysM peptidoglycan-binding domain-containing protein [Arthrobacter sp. ERGS1:01]|uniref:LysM peptidoglycan-binding domain-containing protein n=1 Tax=Arthrobacter sp. ERGS1:01 TaxID=1704044 RepID=UPI0006B50B55|nr:LysM domain-containing protein [Arthrobacter sp. ERGS1:01]